MLVATFLTLIRSGRCVESGRKKLVAELRTSTERRDSAKMGGNGAARPGSLPRRCLILLARRSARSNPPSLWLE
jgi:hypothetical protein